MIINSQKPVAVIYHAVSPYIHHFHNLASELIKAGINVFTVVGCDKEDFFEQYTQSENETVLFDLQKISSIGKIDVLFTATDVPPQIPSTTKRVILSHRNAVSANDSLRLEPPLLSQYLATSDYYIVAMNFPQEELERSRNAEPIPYPSHFIDNGRDTFGYIPAGYPKLDKLISEIERKNIDEKDLKTITFATGHISYSLMSLQQNAEKILEILLKDFPDYVINFRPHPGTREHPLILDIEKRFADNPRFHFDISQSNIDTYANSKIVITDGSFSSLSFSLATLRPILSCAFSSEKEPHDWMNKVGPIVKSLSQFSGSLQEVLESNGEYLEQIKTFRESYISRVGSSTSYIADNIDSIVEGKTHPDWKYCKIKRVNTGDLKGDCHSCLLYYLKHEYNDLFFRLSKQTLDIFPNDSFAKLTHAKGLALRFEKELAAQRVLEAFHSDPEIERYLKDSLFDFIGTIDSLTYLTAFQSIYNNKAPTETSDLHSLLRDSLHMNKMFLDLLRNLNQEDAAIQIGKELERIEKMMRG